jgi:site-specific recombinase XerC
MAVQAALIHPLITDYFASLYDAQLTTKQARRVDMRAICRTWTQRHGTMLDPTTLTDTQARALVTDLVEEQRRGAAIIDRIIQTGRSCWKWLVAEGQAQTNPFAAIPLRDERARRKRKRAVQGSTISLRMLREQLRYAAPQDYHTLTVVLHVLQAGVRPLEMTALQVEDIDRATGQITVRNGYGTARRTVPLNAEAIAAIDAYCVAVAVPTTPHQALIGQYRGEHWQGLSIATIRRRFIELRDQTTAQLHHGIATEEHGASTLTALQSVAELLADLTLDQLRY